MDLAALQGTASEGFPGLAGFICGHDHESGEGKPHGSYDGAL